MNILCLGDSLMQQNNADTFPQAGWPEALNDYLRKPGVAILNFAKNGRSTKSFLDEGRYAKALQAAQAGDIALISFGHNDEKAADTTRYCPPFGTYEDNLVSMANGLRKKGCRSVFISSISRLKYNARGELLHTHFDYPVAMKEAAQKADVPFVDLSALTYAYLSEHPYSTDASFFMICAPGEYPNYQNGQVDTSHLNIVGAKWICRLLVPEFRKIDFLKEALR